MGELATNKSCRKKLKEWKKKKLIIWGIQLTRILF